MNSVIEAGNFYMSDWVRSLNHPTVKKYIKNITSLNTFIFGVFELYDLWQLIPYEADLKKHPPDQSGFWRSAGLISAFSAKVSILLSASVSPYGLIVISNVVGYSFVVYPMQSVFGENTLFAINPWHPRHVVSIAALILGLPATIQLIWQGMKWIIQKICCDEIMKMEDDDRSNTKKIEWMVSYNSITSRPVLHMINQLLQIIWNKSN